MKQKEIFSSAEGDAWFKRNHEYLSGKVIDLSDDIIQSVSEIKKLPAYSDSIIKVLEVGCGEANRLIWLSENLGMDVFGIDPSIKAVELALEKGVHAKQGTADHLSFESGFFDVVIFGFCLYLCDRDDLFKIAQEADRVLKNNGWLIIKDFYSPFPVKREYHHKPGIFSYKMDYRTLFDWHPNYTCFSHVINHHSDSTFTDDQQEWVAVSVLRKRSEV